MLVCAAVVNVPTMLVAPRLPTLALPVALSVPVMLAPVVVTTNTLVPLGAKLILPLEPVIIDNAFVSTMLPLVNKLPPVMLPVAETCPAVVKLPPVIFPVADSNPVTYSPVVANTATLLVPPTPTAMLPPELTTVTFDVPLLMLATLVMTPDKNAPLPKI